MTSLKYAKPRPRALDKRDRVAALKKLDAAESKKVQVRSGGRCEIHEIIQRNITVIGKRETFDLLARCERAALHVHHMLPGAGRRGRGESAKGERKQHVCTRCHSDIGAGILKRIGGDERLWTDVYERQQ